LELEISALSDKSGDFRAESKICLWVTLYIRPASGFFFKIIRQETSLLCAEFLISEHGMQAQFNLLRSKRVRETKEKTNVKRIGLLA